MATKKVTNLVSRLQSNRGVQTRKDAIRDFTEWFIREKPALDAYTIKLLLSGDISNGYSIGIIQFCGKQKNAAEKIQNTTYSPSASNASNGPNGFIGYQYKESVKLALSLWVSCIHESFGQHAKSFQNELKNISLGVYIQARLDIHIQINEMKEYAGILIDAIMFATKFKLNGILPNESAQKSFKAWIKEKKGTEFKDNDDENENEEAQDIEVVEVSGNRNIKIRKKKAKKWEDVDLKNNEEWDDEKTKVDESVAIATAVAVAAVDESDESDESDGSDKDQEYIYDDPLGQKKRNHVRQCIDAFNKKKKVFNDLRIGRGEQIIINQIDTYYQYSPCITYENFNATNFLVEIHNETDFDQLQNGLDKIEKFVRDQSHKMKELVKEHFDRESNSVYGDDTYILCF